MRFEIDWASLIVGSKFAVFALFYFVFEGNFPSTSPRGAHIWRGNLTEGFLCYGFGGLFLEGLIHGGAYFWNFTVSCIAPTFHVPGDINCRYVPRELGGHTLDTLIQRDIPVVANCRPIIVILEIGTNDLTHPDVSVVAVVARLLLLVH